MEQPSPSDKPIARLCPIYAADALSFLNHCKLERSRQVSRYINGVVGTRRKRGELMARDDFDSFVLYVVLLLPYASITAP